MHQSVRDGFIDFTEHLEGKVAVMYLDTHNPPLVTIGYGNLIDPVSEALKLSFVDADGAPVSEAQVIAEWNRVKADVAHSQSATSHWFNTAILKLTQESMIALVFSKLDEFERLIKKRWAFADFETFPADAQLGILSMCWAMGPGFHFPLFELAISQRNFHKAAVECRINEINNRGIPERNRVDINLFWNADMVETHGYNRAALIYPHTQGNYSVGLG